MRDQLENLCADLVAYRAAVNRVYSSKLSRSRDCRRYLVDVLVCATRLYLDSLSLTKALSSVESMPGASLIGIDRRRYASFRKRFRERLRSRPAWAFFRPEIPFAEFIGLRTLESYLENFGLHIPEVYEETFRVEQYARRWLDHNERSVEALLVAMQHMSRNHISFLVPALQWAADEGSWCD